ncbi:MAG: peptidylprolyl isomerase [Phycisphaerales bacterium]|nr:MAG: peptidylprolyl isomerase [Phycisphaerales bacterium]
MRNWIFSVGILVCLAVFAALFCPGCGSDDPNGSGADKSEPNVVAPETEAVAVTVNGVNILESEIEKLIRPNLDKLAEKTKNAPAETVESYAEQFRQLALEQLIRRVLLDAQIQKAKIVISDLAVRSHIEELASAQGMSVAAFFETMKRHGRSLEDIKREIRAGLARNQFMAAQWAGKINVSDEDARKYYEENTDEFNVPELVRASHILIQPEAGGDPNEAMAKARTKAEGLLAQIKGGADFAELAKANSDCLSAPNGGDLEFFPRGKATPAFEKAAFNLKVGEISDVVETDYGFHIIKVTDHKDPSTISFEQAKERIIQKLTEEKQVGFANEYLEKLKAEAEIVYPSKM